LPKKPQIKGGVNSKGLKPDSQPIFLLWVCVDSVCPFADIADCGVKLRTLFPAIVIGAILGLALGYTLNRVTAGIDDFSIWISDAYTGYNYDALFWTLGGVIVAWAIAFIRG
jgi:hypothetical protein